MNTSTNTSASMSATAGPDLPVSEVLDRAADQIEERGWGAGGRGWGYNPGDGTLDQDAPLCIEGGILAALGYPYQFDNGTRWREEFVACPAYVAVAGYLGLTGAFDDVYSYNDANGRTEGEVIATLRACAAVEAARESSIVTELVSA